MTLDLGPIKERAAKASAGPWKDGGSSIDQDVNPWDAVVALEERGSSYQRYEVLVISEPNRDFIVNSATDIPALVAEVEALRAALGAEREARDDITKRHLEIADKIDAGESEDEDYDSGVQDGLAYALDAIAARRAPKIGGGE